MEPDCSDSAKDLISRLILLDVAKRWTATEALEHSWLVGVTASEAPLVYTSLSPHLIDGLLYHHYISLYDHQ
jgi:serine/threonine protein kinase